MPAQSRLIVHVVPRKDVRAMIDTCSCDFSNWALISIFNTFGPVVTGDSMPILSRLGCRRTLSIRFSDITKEEYDRLGKYRSSKRRLVLFSAAHARRIITFVRKVRDSVDDLVVHCEAGISRSGAVGLFVVRYLDLDEQRFWDQNKLREKDKLISPNPYIYDMLYRLSGMRDDYGGM